MKIHLQISAFLLLCVFYFSCKEDEPKHAIGEYYEGGIIFFVYDPPSSGGYIAAPYDQSSGAIWGCQGTDISQSMAYNWELGAGAYNTKDIIEECVGPDSANIAARICYALSLDGFDDWYLPAAYELEELYKQRDKVGGFEKASYWSSTQTDINSGWRLNFANFDRGPQIKNTQNRVRAIRKFSD